MRRLGLNELVRIAVAAVLVCGSEGLGSKKHIKYVKHLLPALMFVPSLIPLAAPNKHHHTKNTKVIHIPHHYPVHIPIHKHTTSFHTVGTQHVEGKRSYGAGKHKVIMVEGHEDAKYVSDDGDHLTAHSHVFPKFKKYSHKNPRIHDFENDFELDKIFDYKKPKVYHFPHKNPYR